MFNALTKCTTISANEATLLYEIIFDKEKFNSAPKKSGLNLYNIPFTTKPIYSSIYEEQWQIDDGPDGAPKKI